MPIVNAEKTINVTRMNCGGTAEVTLRLTALPTLLREPMDLALVLDRSGSMAGPALAEMKRAARQLLWMLASASGGQAGTCMGGGSRVGLVSFARCAVTDAALTEDLTRLDRALDRLTAADSTNHYAAFAEAKKMLQGRGDRRGVLVLFTDGATTVGPSPRELAAALRASGVEIYCIGLNTRDQNLREWASDPDADHVATASSPAELRRVFRHIGGKLVGVGAEDVVLEETVTEDFEITRIRAVSKGRAQQLSPRQLQWSLDRVGELGEETVFLTFTIRHVGTQGGEKAVNESLHYRDRACSQVTFPCPTVWVECGETPCPGPCPATQIHMAGCEEAAVLHLPQVQLEDQGRVIHLSLLVKNLCPHRRAAVAVWLTEVDDHGQEVPRARKILTVPAHDEPGCRDVLLDCITFVVPEETEGGGCPEFCRERLFRVRTAANYLDSGDLCCPDILSELG